MIIISYDIADDKMRTRFSKMLTMYGAIRLQFSVYELSNTKRVIDNLMIRIKDFSKCFTMDDSVVVFNVSDKDVIKFGNSIHRDMGIVFL